MNIHGTTRYFVLLEYLGKSVTNLQMVKDGDCLSLPPGGVEAHCNDDDMDKLDVRFQLSDRNTIDYTIENSGADCTPKTQSDKLGGHSTREVLMLRSSLFALACACASQALGAGSNYAEAMRVRALIAQESAQTSQDFEVEQIKLPVSRGFHQLGTELCWSYAQLNALESAYRVRHESSNLELSRRTMQYYTIADRYVLRIHGEASYTGERGVAVDAMRLLTDNGLVAFADFTDIADPYGDFDLRRAVDRAPNEAAKLEVLEAGLGEIYGVPPQETHLESEAPITRAALTENVIEGAVWQSYAISRDGREGWRAHPDPDARPGVQSWFMAASKIEARIKAALQAGYPVEITIGGHCLLIYGAAYDASSRPTRYFIKDSYPDYFYEANPRETLANLLEMTTAVLR